ncbi:MAG: hypothetical protein AAF564_21780 [Bacteroidota bacterium]
MHAPRHMARCAAVLSEDRKTPLPLCTFAMPSGNFVEPSGSFV